jgi:hypothetical protein
LQTELIAKQNENSALTEQQARLSSQFSILFQKKDSLQKSLENEQIEVNFWHLVLHADVSLGSTAACGTTF